MTEDAENELGAAEFDAVSYPSSHRLLTMSGQQRELLRALEERNPALGRMYLGALMALGERSNPDRYAQAAHSVRELMEKLPEVLDVPTSAVKESLVVKVRELEDSYRAVQKRSPSFVDEHGWKGLIDKHLANFFAKLDTFLDWLTTHKPRRREQLNNVLIRLDGSRRVLPRSLSDLNVRAWDDKRDFFQKTAHHRGETTEAELLQWLDALELFLLDRLRPRTFDDFDAIDSLLGEDHLDAEA